jgi:hypothetical protein
MVTDEIRKVTEEQESEVPKVIVYEDATVIWEPNERTLEKKFQRAVTVSKDFGLNVNLDSCVVMKISQKTGEWKDKT